MKCRSSSGLATLVVLSTLCSCAVAQDSTQPSQMKAWGLPIIFLAVLGACGFLMRNHFILVVSHAKADREILAVVGASALTMFWSIFLFFSSAWSYALIGTLLALMAALGSIKPQFAHHLLLVNVAWFAILVGIPSGVSAGIIQEASSGCSTFYPDYTNTMCAQGWVSFVVFVACVLVGLNLLTLLTLANQVMKSDGNPSDSNLHAPLRQNEYVPVTSNKTLVESSSPQPQSQYQYVPPPADHRP